MDKDELFDVEIDEGVEGMQVKLVYSYYHDGKGEAYDTRPGWVATVEDEINEFLEGKTVYALDMDFAPEDKNRIYGKVLYREE